MVLCEDSDCTVCFFPYSRMDRIPRVLHCRHTFCELCLEAMQQVRGSYLALACPLCRRVTCIDRGLSLQEALWVDSKQWEQIAELCRHNSTGSATSAAQTAAGPPAGGAAMEVEETEGGATAVASLLLLLLFLEGNAFGKDFSENYKKNQSEAHFLHYRVYLHRIFP
uniref:Im:7152348 n=1 Tax=Oryzias latipes TaxID=8090 RepID=A0A3P9KN04_ORYLA